MAILLPDTIITTAGTYLSGQINMRDGAARLPLNIVGNLTFVYGSGGTSINVYLQTSFDVGVTWMDVVAFLQLTTASAKQLGTVIRSAAVTPGVFRDANTTAGQVFQFVGPLWRAKAVVIGTYAGNSTLHLDVSGDG
jgi:hypothetical protein